MNNATLNSATFNGGNILFLQTNFKDVGCSVNVSDYKWLSKTLKTAQQQFGLRPYYQARIVDDSLAPNAIKTAPLQPLQGSMTTAPDGSILAVGLDTSNNVGFWKATNGSDVQAILAGAPTTILEN